VMGFESDDFFPSAPDADLHSNHAVADDPQGP
jgi:hypothetical protein